MSKATENLRNSISTLMNVCDDIKVPITFADPDQYDIPLIYANAAFEEFSGWPADEVIGKNCRFLQGPDTDKTVTDEMGLTCSQRRSDIFSLINYRRNGEKFVNIVALKPFNISTSKTVFIGCQMEYRQSRLQSDMKLHSEAIGSVLHLVRNGIASDKKNVSEMDVLRLDSLNMRFESAFKIVQNTLIRHAAQEMLAKLNTQ